MKILYISNTFPLEGENSTIYTDLAEELKKSSHDITVVASTSSKKIKKTRFTKERNIKILRVKNKNIIGGNFIKKGLSIITLVPNMIRAMKKNIDGKFDLILFESPPVTMSSIIKWAMKEYNCPSYLMLKDIFPQNAVDLKIIKKSNLIYNYFKFQEKELYKTATIIGCMSEGNRNYIINNNPFLDESKIEIFPNTKKINKFNNEKNISSIREDYNIPIHSVVALYGGNMGKPQGLDFLNEVLIEYRNNDSVFFVLVGRGTEKEKIKESIIKNKIKNVIVLDELQRSEYENIVKESDIGLIFLNRNFTIPNYPSRILSYFEAGLPIIAATDVHTDYNFLIDESKSGYWVEAGNIKDFKGKMNQLIESKELRMKMGKSGRLYLEKNLNTKISVDLLEKALSKINN